jgi:hypothetical protein
MGELQMTVAKEKKHEVKVFVLKASDVLEKLLPVFDERRVFVTANVKGGGADQVLQQVAKVTVPTTNKAILDPNNGKL